MTKIPKNLFVLEMANNHMGDVNHGIKLINAFGKVCRKYPFNFALKFQYRELKTFIHPKMKQRIHNKFNENNPEQTRCIEDINPNLQLETHSKSKYCKWKFDSAQCYIGN